MIYKHLLLNKFPGIIIPSRPTCNDEWTMIYHKDDKLINRIKHEIRDIYKYNEIKVRIKTGNMFKTIPEQPRNEQQFVAFTNNTSEAQKLDDFLTKNNYCKETKFASNYRENKHIIRWITEESKVNTMMNHWDSRNSLIKIKKSGHNEYVQTKKINAITALIQIMRQQVLKIASKLPLGLHNTIKYFVNTQICDKGIPPINNIKTLEYLRMYPFLQKYIPHQQVYNPTISRIGKLKILFLNIDGGAAHKLSQNKLYIQHILRKHNAHIMAFVDTRHKRRPTFKIPGYTLIAHKICTEKVGGILVFKLNTLKDKFSVLTICKSNMIMIKHKSHAYQHKRILIFGYCRPYNKYNVNNINLFFDELKLLSAEAKKQDIEKVYICGDFNARLGKETGDNNITYNLNARSLKEFKAKHKFKVANAIFTKGQSTFRTTNNGASIIDYAMCHNPNEEIDEFSIDHHLIYRAHKPIVMTLNESGASIGDAERIFNFNSFNIENINEDLITKHKNILISGNKIMGKMIDKLSQRQHSRCIQHKINNIIDLCITFYLHKATISALGICRCNSTDEWHSSNIDLLDIKCRLEIAGNTNNQKKVDELQQLYDKKVTEIQEKAIADETEAMRNRSIPAQQKNMKRMLKKEVFQFPVETLKFNNIDMPTNKALAAFYQTNMGKKPQLYNETERTVEECINDVDDTSQMIQVNLESITSAIKRTNKKGAAGIDGITQPMLRINENHTAALLCKLFRNWCTTNVIPKTAKIGLINSISKTKGGKLPQTPGDYRPITLLPVIYKVYERIILHKLWDYGVDKNIHELQGGFRHGRGVLEQIGTLRIISEDANTRNNELYCMLLDIKKSI